MFEDYGMNKKQKSKNSVPKTSTERDWSPLTKNATEDELMIFLRREHSFRANQRSNKSIMWKRMQEFIKGNQTDSYNYEIEMFEDSRKTSHNKLRKIAEVQKESLSSSEKIPVAKTTSTRNEDIMKAKITSALIEEIWNKNKISEEVQKTVRGELTWCGNSFVRICWNPNLGRTYEEKISELVRENKEKYSNEVIKKIKERFDELKDTGKREGDLEIININPFTVFPEHISIDGLKDSQSILLVDSIDANVAIKKYNLDRNSKKLVIEEVDAISKQTINYDRSHIFSSYSQDYAKNNKLKNQFAIREFFQKPNDENPDGRYILAISDEIIYDGQLPFINGREDSTLQHRTFPIVQIKTDNAPGEFFQDPLMKDIISIQIKYNETRDMIFRYMKVAAFGKLLFERGSVEKAITNNVEDIIIYSKGSKPPTVLVYPTVPQDTWQEIRELKTELESMTVVNRVAISGEGGSQIRSTKQQEMAAEQSNKSMDGVRKSLYYGFREIAIQAVKIYIQKVPNEIRMFSESMEHYDLETYWETKNLVKSIYINDQDALSTRESKEEETMRAINMIMAIRNSSQGMPQPELEKATLEHSLFSTEMISSFSPNKIDEDRVCREHNNLREGNNISLNNFDNHEIHLSKHREYLLGLFEIRYNKLVLEKQIDKANKEKKVLEAHMNDHQGIVANNNAKRQAQEQMANQKG